MKKLGWFQKLFLFSLMLALLLTGCGQQAKTTVSPPPEEKKIGVLDLNQAVKAHPQWSQLEQINTQINILQKQGQAISLQTNTTQELNQQDVEGQKMQSAAKAQEWEREQQKLSQGLAGKMNLKKAELESRFQAEAEKAQEEKTKEIESYKKQLQLLYGPSIVNIQLKLQFSSLSSEDREKKKKELDTLTQEQEQKLQAKQEDLSKELEQEIQGLKNQLSQELDKYQSQEETKIKQQLSATYQELQKSSQESANQSWQQAVAAEKQQTQQKEQSLKAIKEKIKNLISQKALLESKIRQDLQKIAGKIAQAQQLKAVVVNYRATGSAVDITMDVIAELKGLN